MYAKEISNKFHAIDVLFFFAIVAGQYAVSYVEMGLHGFVVGNTLGVVTLYDTMNLVGCHDS